MSKRITISLTGEEIDEIQFALANNISMYELDARKMEFLELDDESYIAMSNTMKRMNLARNIMRSLDFELDKAHHMSN